ncbi:MAG TPA: cytochrome ubiquinol oxidase subunit I, partial [Candidatus Hydrogenedentes bacterium]|nr:cytochrome ubiquinol oxidase subunit I [Candidatus Hydrogenedentota bacterium]
AVIVPYLSNETGWIAAEVGRQPWIVWHLLKTQDAWSPSLDAQQVLGSLIMFGVVYLLLFAVWIYTLNDKIQKGPDYHPPLPEGPKGFMAAAEAMADPSGESMTMAHADENGNGQKKDGN